MLVAHGVIGNIVVTALSFSCAVLGGVKWIVDMPSKREFAASFVSKNNSTSSADDKKVECS